MLKAVLGDICSNLFAKASWQAGMRHAEQQAQRILMKVR